MNKVLGMPQVLKETEENSNKLEIKNVDGYTHVYLNGAEVYDVKPDIKISANKHIPNKGVEIALTFYAELNIEK